MKTVLVHPLDRSTDFLLPLHKAASPCVAVRNNLPKKVLLSMISDSENVIAMGHGTPNGLMSVGQFPDANGYIIDPQAVPLLQAKQHNVFIWCYAYSFAKTHNIPCFASDMFISELAEARYLGLKGISESDILESNTCFVKDLAAAIHLPLPELYNRMMHGSYAQLAERNWVAAYNFARLYLHLPIPTLIHY